MGQYRDLRDAQVRAGVEPGGLIRIKANMEEVTERQAWAEDLSRKLEEVGRDHGSVA